jgi:uncharacterized protein with NRDE domain
VSAFLAATEAPLAWLDDLRPPPGAYAGFNLVALTLRGRGAAAQLDAAYLNNLPGRRARPLEPGIHVVSNATLDVSWPKTERLKRALAQALAACGRHTELLSAEVLEALADRTPAPEPELPSTGLAPDRERLLSAPFIVDEHYGTRASTLVLVSRAGEVHFLERSFGPRGRPRGTVAERFRLGEP